MYYELKRELQKNAVEEVFEMYTEGIVIVENVSSLDKEHPSLPLPHETMV